MPPNTQESPPAPQKLTPKIRIIAAAYISQSSSAQVSSWAFASHGLSSGYRVQLIVTFPNFAKISYIFPAGAKPN